MSSHYGSPSHYLLVQNQFTHLTFSPCSYPRSSVLVFDELPSPRPLQLTVEISIEITYMNSQNATVATHYTNGQWDIGLERRRLTAVQIEQFTALSGVLYGHSLSNGEDEMKWELDTRRKVFSCRTLMFSIQEERRLHQLIQTRDIRRSKVWVKACLNRVNVFIWLVFWRRVMTKDRCNRLLGLNLDPSCVLCNHETESLDHLLLHCQVTKGIWLHFIAGFNPVTVDFTSVVALQENRSCMGLNDVGKAAWKLLFHAISWTLWTERNDRIFKHKASSVDQIIVSIKFFIWEHLKCRRLLGEISIDSFMHDWATLIRDS